MTNVYVWVAGFLFLCLFRPPRVVFGVILGIPLAILAVIVLIAGVFLGLVADIVMSIAKYLLEGH